MSKDIRPGFTMIRCCRNCRYYRYTSDGFPDHFKGMCRLPLVEDKTAAPLPTHGTCYCDAHTWKADGKTVHKHAIRLGILPPEGTY